MSSQFGIMGTGADKLGMLAFADKQGFNEPK